MLRKNFQRTNIGSPVSGRPDVQGARDFVVGDLVHVDRVPECDGAGERMPIHSSRNSDI